jgi:hypothetical protein
MEARLLEYVIYASTWRTFVHLAHYE